MLCNREGIRIFFLKVVFSMGCFFGCFRVQDGDRSRPHLFSNNNDSSKSRDPLVSRNQLSSLFSLEEAGSPCKDEESNGLQSTNNPVDGDTDDGDLKAEAKFLKSCGTLLQTPVEIRKASEKPKVLPHDGGDESCKFHSWLPGTSWKELNWEEQHDGASISNIKLHEEQGRIRMQENSVPLQHSSISTGQKQSIANTPKDNEVEHLEMVMGMPIHSNGSNDLDEATAEIPNATSQCKKCVRFEYDTTHNSGMDFFTLRSSPPERESHNCNLPDPLCTDTRKAKLIGQKHSPYPTPLKLTDEMETPGTVYPAKPDNFTGGKNARIRSQYIYPVFNPIENASQWNALKNDFENCWAGHPGESFERCSKGICESVMTPERGFKDNAEGMAQNHRCPTPVDASLSHWLKPVSSNDRIQNHKVIPNGNSYTGKCSDDDRPILGTVATHWTDDEPSDIPPKSWDGNGIPNSTNKYKEDQKVSWHATPFEERLEKALSDERLFPQRNLISGKPIDFDESEESDTAASNFRTLDRLQSPIQL